MKKALLIVAMLLLATPVMATTTVTAALDGAVWVAPDGNKVQTVVINYSSDVNVRAFALDINIASDGNSPNFQGIRSFKTGECNSVSKGYGIFPSRFRDFIVVTGPNWVDPNYNPTTAWNEPGTTDHRWGMGFPQMVVEMGALFAGDANKPALSGTLFRFDVNAWGKTGTYHLSVAPDTLRGGVVNTDGNSISASYVGVDVVFPVPVCTLPNVVSVAEATATASITGAGFALGTRTTTCSDVSGIVAGDIISTNPAAGDHACGISVDYVVSTGSCGCIVPNVVGHAEATATAEITAAGFTNGTRTTAHSDTVANGNIISTNPAYTGNPITCGGAVDRVVSLGPCVVPNVVGKLVADACTAIDTNGFVVGAKTYNWSATVAKGRVISQNPASGGSPGCGTTVTFVVSQGPTPVACFDPCATAFSQQKSQYNMYIAQKWDPNCWCEYPTGSGFQCHGDADGKATAAPASIRIYTNDLTLVTNSWGKKLLAYPDGANPCADIDHKATAAPASIRVYTNDLARLTGATTGNWGRKGCPTSTATLPRNCPLDDASNTTYVKPAACNEGK
jgi:beta-lactam-binding protein with PASTA domain